MYVVLYYDLLAYLSKAEEKLFNQAKEVVKRTTNYFTLRYVTNLLNQT